MRRPVLSALIVVIVLLAGASVVLFQKYQKTSADYRDTKAAEESAESRYAQTIDAIAEIQDSLSAIALGDTAIHMLPNERDAEQRMSRPDTREALDRIAVLRASVQRNKERIRQLESNLKKSGLKVTGLQHMVANLKQQVSQKETMIAALSTRVDSLQTQVTGLATQVQQGEDEIHTQQQTIEDKRRELATVYYIVGSKKDLTTNGVIIAKGGMLGIGKTLTPSGKVNESLLTPIDTDQETVIRTQAAKAQVISAQPVTSYELRLVDGHMELHILDAQEFRKVKQVVIMTRA